MPTESITQWISLRETNRSMKNYPFEFLDLKKVPNSEKWQDKHMVLLNGIKIATGDGFLCTICKIMKENNIHYIFRDYTTANQQNE